MSDTETVKNKSVAPPREEAVDYSEVSRWNLFKHLFFNKFGTMVFLNLITVLFFVPAAIVIIMFYLNSSIALGLVPYSANLGIGYPVVVDAAAIGAMTAYNYQFYQFALLIPCLAFFGIGVSGNLYVMRKLVCGENARTFRDFFVGIKRGWLHAAVMGTLIGAALLSVVFAFGFFDAYGYGIAYKITATILTVLLSAVVIVFAAFYVTQIAAFKQPVATTIKNSFKLIATNHIVAVAMIGVAVAPVFLIFIPGILMLYIMLYFMLGISYTTLVVTLYTSSCYKGYVPPPVSVKPDKSAQQKTAQPIVNDSKNTETNEPNAEKSAEQTDLGQTSSVKKPPKQTQYKNPKKGNKAKQTGNDKRQ